VQYGDARHCQQMGLNFGQLVDGDSFETRISYRAQPAFVLDRRVVGCFYDETSGVEFLTARLERFLRRIDL
jgi:hypothetical protein